MMKNMIAAACISIAAVFLPLADAQPSLPPQPDSAKDTAVEAENQIAITRLNGAEWLLKMATGIRQRNYQISLVVNRPNSDAIPYLWRHGVFDDGVSMEQLNVLNGPGKEYIRVNQTVSIFEPDVAPYSITGDLIDGPIPNQLLIAPLELRAGYEFIAVGRGRVSGRVAQQIRIISRDNSRYSYQLWVDEQTAMPLKLNMLDLNGQLVKQVQVSQIQVTEEPDPYFERINHDMLPAVMTTAAAAHRHAWQISYMPDGMNEVKRNTHRLMVTGQVVEYAMLSDGLVNVSVYVMPAANTELQNNVYRHHAKTLLTRIEGDIQISIVGEIPPKTANKIAASLTARIQ